MTLPLPGSAPLPRNLNQIRRRPRSEGTARAGPSWEPWQGGGGGTGPHEHHHSGPLHRDGLGGVSPAPPAAQQLKLTLVCSEVGRSLAHLWRLAWQRGKNTQRSPGSFPDVAAPSICPPPVSCHSAYVRVHTQTCTHRYTHTPAVLYFQRMTQGT